ncbi:MAG: HIT family protein [Candidatus Aenigmarchaeota archaeon]|nr:HIT family protein [Candidatus Aenigmarchaeota archaeon]
MSCPFCTIEEKDIVGKGFVARAQIIFENEKFILFYNLKPVFMGHILLSPKKHIPSFLEMGENEVEEMSRILHMATKAVVHTYNAEGFNIALQEGEIAGQSIPHLHWHIIPRTKDESGEWYEKIEDPSLRVVGTEETKKNVALIKEAWRELYGG